MIKQAKRLIKIIRKRNKSAIKDIKRSVNSVVLQENQREIIVRMFDRINESLLLDDMIHELELNRYAHAGRLIRDAIQEGLVYVDAIEDDGSVYLALTDWGEEMWDKHK